MLLLNVKYLWKKTGDPQVNSSENIFNYIKEVTCKREK